MSKPREYWWPYVKAMVRHYPDIKRAYEAGEEMTNTKLHEYQAVTKAIDITREKATGKGRLEIVERVLWRKGNTLYNASVAAHVSEGTANRYHKEFLYLVADMYGLTQ